VREDVFADLRVGVPREEVGEVVNDRRPGLEAADDGREGKGFVARVRDDGARDVGPVRSYLLR